VAVKRSLAMMYVSCGIVFLTCCERARIAPFGTRFWFAQIIISLQTLGFDNYYEALRLYLLHYRQEQDDRLRKDVHRDVVSVSPQSSAAAAAAAAAAAVVSQPRKRNAAMAQIQADDEDSEDLDELLSS
jgi:hypothetical protein